VVIVFNLRVANLAEESVFPRDFVFAFGITENACAGKGVLKDNFVLIGSESAVKVITTVTLSLAANTKKPREPCVRSERIENGAP